MLIDLPVLTDIYDFLNIGIILILTNVYWPSLELQLLGIEMGFIAVLIFQNITGIRHL